MMVKIGAICVASSLRTRGDILSGAAVLFGFRFFRSLCTPFSVILMSLMVLNFPVILHCF